MNTLTKLTLAAACLLSINTAQAYNSGQGSSSCDKPMFSEFQPAANKYTQSLSEFSMMASANTVPTSVHVTVSYGQTHFDFPAKELDITVQKSGRLEIKGKLDRPIEHGFARISVTAHSKPTCEKTDGFLVRIQ
jgi:methionine synthase II (cobalamin-independent)